MRTSPDIADIAILYRRRGQGVTNFDIIVGYWEVDPGVERSGMSRRLYRFRTRRRRVSCDLARWAGCARIAVCVFRLPT